MTRRRASFFLRWALAAVAVVAAGFWLHGRFLGDDSGEDRGAVIALLAPDDVEVSEPMVAVWADAAREEGFRLEVVSDSGFLRPGLGSGRGYAGVIVPDSVHARASNILLERLDRYVRGGGQLMLVYDAATHTPAGAYYPGKAPLSALVGVAYALYDSRREKTHESGAVSGTPETLAELGVPPGKTLPLPAGTGKDDSARVIGGYEYGPLRYASFVTDGEFAGRRLLNTASGGLAAGSRQVGKGSVLFVNLPLGYLKGQTDGLLLHCFLRYFAGTLLGLPALSAAPGGVGGLVFNLHVDSNAAIKPMSQLDSLGLLNQGPFSIHFTAGPDARKVNDGLGLNLSYNPALLEWIRRFQARGDALGSHGGWIHDYFGLNVNEQNRAEMEKYLELNAQAMDRITGTKGREYSAPQGTQPKWVTAWLEAHGFVAYYFMGNTGMAPTRSYREGRLHTRNIWSFPVLTLGSVASFEEFEESGIDEAEVAQWLREVSDFAADSGTIRTIYSHPPGFRRYPGALQAWFEHTRRLLDEKRFSWYTMTRVADFLNRREQARWQVRRQGDAVAVEASHPADLSELAWRLPKSGWERPRIDAGQARIEERQNHWLVIAGRGQSLRFSSSPAKGRK